MKSMLTIVTRVPNKVTIKISCVAMQKKSGVRRLSNDFDDLSLLAIDKSFLADWFVS